MFQTLPQEHNAVAASATWLQGVLGGSIATATAIIAVAAIGLMLLSGRMDVRRASRVVLGCFLVFGAATIASGLSGAFLGDGAATEIGVQPPTPLIAVPSNVPAYDPYAGAAVPQR